MNNKTAVELYGYPSGIRGDNYLQYVGYGDATSCGTMTKCFGYVSTSPSKGPGCYMPCQNSASEIFDASNCYFLAAWVNLLKFSVKF